jgi:hypothetical protein
MYLQPSSYGGFFFIIYLFHIMPGPTIQIFDIPLKAFQQFQSGRRFSAEIVLSNPPLEGTNVILHCQHQTPPIHTPHPIHTSVKHAVFLDTMLTSRNYYALTFNM